MEQYIFLHHYIGYPFKSFQQRMNKRFFPLAFLREYRIRKIDKVFKIVNASAGYQVVFVCKAQSFYQVSQQRWINVFIINKSNGLALLTVL